MDRLLVDVWIDPDRRAHPITAGATPTAYVGLSARIANEIFAGALVIGLDSITPGVHSQMEYLWIGDYAIKIGDQFELLDGAKAIGNATVLAFL